MQFADRLLRCSDCNEEFVFTAGEQLFFYERQFKNDPKRCKLCKAKRGGIGKTAPNGGVALPLSRTETRTDCSACGIETTVPFKPTQGRPVLCRACFQMKKAPSAVAAVAAMDSPSAQVEAASAALDAALAAACDVHASEPPLTPEERTVQMIAETPAAAVENAIASGTEIPQA